MFQLFAALLEANPIPGLSDYYQSLIPPIIMPSLWESKGNVPALVRLLTSLIPRGVDTITKNNQLEPILGIFQKLISSKANESYSFDLIESVLESFPVSVPPSLPFYPSSHSDLPPTDSSPLGPRLAQRSSPTSPRCSTSS